MDKVKLKFIRGQSSLNTSMISTLTFNIKFILKNRLGVSSKKRHPIEELVILHTKGHFKAWDIKYQVSLHEKKFEFDGSECGLDIYEVIFYDQKKSYHQVSMRGLTKSSIEMYGLPIFYD